jgi:D-cysteine desulfhydrase
MADPSAARFEELKSRLPYVSLGSFPTPVERLSGLARHLGTPELFIKRDDRSSHIYGGNKVRKLEYILGEALARKKTHTITFGYAGSNHTLAVAVFARRLGLQPVSLHLPQPNARYLRKNLLYQKLLGTELHHYESLRSIYAGTLVTATKVLLKTARMPAVIPPGGSNVPGVIGMMGSVFELHRQIRDGTLPEPDVIYLPLGSCGTGAGIALGIKALGLKTRIRAVRVSERGQSSFKTVCSLFSRTAKRLQKLVPSFPRVALREEDFEVCHDYLGQGYAHFTEEGMSAVRLLSQTDGIPLDGTYSGKAMAALIDDATKGDIGNRVTLFWNTYNSVDFEETVGGIDFRELPEGYHRYFKSDDQPLEIRDA